MARILLEIIATTVDDCVAAESGGADRIELCAAITTGGLTPSLGTLIEAKKQQIMARAQGRIEVLPGGGVRSHNVGQLVEATGCTQVHLTAFSARCDASLSTSPIRFGSIPGAPSPSYECVDREAVRRMRETLDAMGGAAQP
jgi:copper homeostasis protein